MMIIINGMEKFFNTHFIFLCFFCENLPYARRVSPRSARLLIDKDLHRAAGVSAAGALHAGGIKR